MDLLADAIPPELRALLWEGRDRIAAIQVQSNEPHIPWELCRLERPGAKRPTPEGRFLGELGLVRWLRGESTGFPPTQLRCRPGRRYVIAPVYATEPLPAAQEEAAALEQRYGFELRPTTIETFLDLISEPGAFDLFHYAGHGRARVDDLESATLVLADGHVDAPITGLEIRATADLTDDTWRPTIVINACEIGRAGWRLTRLGGLAATFLDAGAGLFVAPLWSVDDGTAAAFIAKLYEELFAGSHLAAAVTTARASAHVANDPTWLAYTVYGHPDARLDLTT